MGAHPIGTARKDGMTGMPEPADKAAAEAAEWSVLLMDDPDDRDLRRRFEAWRRQSAHNAVAWSEMQRTANLAEEVLPDYADEWRPLVTAKARRRWLVPMAALAVAAVIGWVAAPMALLRLQADHVTDTAEIRTIGLEDGSTLVLAPDSAVAVAYLPGERRVRLLRGEAFFAVKPDKERPFKVTARTVETSVLGTRFDVRLDDTGVGVAVEEGRVRVIDSRGAGEVLSAGDVVQVAATGEIVRTALEPNLVAMWRQRQVYLLNRPLAEAVDAIRRYYRGKIVVTDAALEEQLTTGVFDMTDPEAALRGLAQAHGATVRRISPWLLVVFGS